MFTPALPVEGLKTFWARGLPRGTPHPPRRGRRGSGLDAGGTTRRHGPRRSSRALGPFLTFRTRTFPRIISLTITLSTRVVSTRPNTTTWPQTWHARATRTPRHKATPALRRQLGRSNQAFEGRKHKHRKETPPPPHPLVRSQRGPRGSPNVKHARRSHSQRHARSRQARLEMWFHGLPPENRPTNVRGRVH